MTDTTHLVMFLQARLAEDEAVARAATHYDLITVENRTQAEEDHARRHDPAHVLADVEAKRRIVERHHPDRILESWYWLERRCAECGHQWHRYLANEKPTVIGPEQGCPTMRLLASVYADHPDYRAEWAVDAEPPTIHPLARPTDGNTT